MPEAYIHIGAAKCASSLIQGLLAEPDARTIVEEETGAVYIDAVCKTIQSCTPVFDMEDYFTLDTMAHIRDSIPDHDVVLSVENVFGMHSHRENSCQSSVEMLKFLFKDFNVKIFMFVRRQDTYIESLYGQDVKRQETRPFKNYVSEMMLDNLHWDKIAETYSAFDLTVRPFENKVAQTAGYKDFLDELFQWLGAKVEIENLPVINPSLSRGGLDVQMQANRSLPAQEAYNLSFWLEKHAAKPPGESVKLFNGEGVLARYRESNKRLFRRWMPEFDPAYYVG